MRGEQQHPQGGLPADTNTQPPSPLCVAAGIQKQLHIVLQCGDLSALLRRGVVQERVPDQALRLALLFSADVHERPRGGAATHPLACVQVAFGGASTSGQFPRCLQKSGALEQHRLLRVAISRGVLSSKHQENGAAPEESEQLNKLPLERPEPVP